MKMNASVKRGLRLIAKEVSDEGPEMILGDDSEMYQKGSRERRALESKEADLAAALDWIESLDAPSVTIGEVDRGLAVYKKSMKRKPRNQFSAMLSVLHSFQKARLRAMEKL